MPTYLMSVRHLELFSSDVYYLKLGIKPIKTEVNNPSRSICLFLCFLLQMIMMLGDGGIRQVVTIDTQIKNCLQARLACLRCYFSSPSVHNNTRTYPTPSFLFFVVGGSLSPPFIICGQLLKLKPIRSLVTQKSMVVSASIAAVIVFMIDS